MLPGLMGLWGNNTTTPGPIMPTPDGQLQRMQPQPMAADPSNYDAQIAEVNQMLAQARAQGVNPWSTVFSAASNIFQLGAGAMALSAGKQRGPAYTLQGMQGIAEGIGGLARTMEIPGVIKRQQEERIGQLMDTRSKIENTENLRQQIGLGKRQQDFNETMDLLKTGISAAKAGAPEEGAALFAKGFERAVGKSAAENLAARMAGDEQLEKIALDVYRTAGVGFDAARMLDPKGAKEMAQGYLESVNGMIATLPEHQRAYATALAKTYANSFVSDPTGQLTRQKLYQDLNSKERKWMEMLTDRLMATEDPKSPYYGKSLEELTADSPTAMPVFLHKFLGLPEVPYAKKLGDQIADKAVTAVLNDFRIKYAPPEEKERLIAEQLPIVMGAYAAAYKSQVIPMLDAAEVADRATRGGQEIQAQNPGMSLDDATTKWFDLHPAEKSFMESAKPVAIQADSLMNQSPASSDTTAPATPKPPVKGILGAVGAAAIPGMGAGPGMQSFLYQSGVPGLPANPLPSILDANAKVGQGIVSEIGALRTDPLATSAARRLDTMEDKINMAISGKKRKR